MIKGISAVTFATHDMKKAVQFYQCLGFKLKYGGENAGFSSFFAGNGFVNLTEQDQEKSGLGGGELSSTLMMLMPFIIWRLSLAWLQILFQKMLVGANAISI